MRIIKYIRGINFVRFMQGLTLLIVAAFLFGLFTAISIVFTPIWYLVRFKFQGGLNALGEWMAKIALSIDQSGNVVSGKMFEILLTKRDPHPFGNEDDTISYVIARNKYKGKLNILGRFIGWILDKIDTDHLRKSIQSKIQSDIEARKRIEEDKYFQ